METYISVVMVCRNGVDFLDKVFSTLNAQTYKNYEFIFVDDQSTDNTVELVTNYQKENPDKKITITSTKDKPGLASGRNIGISLACGKYIFFHDVDDWMDPDCLEVLAAASENGRYTRVVEQVRFIKDGKIYDTFCLSPDQSYWTKNYMQGDLFRKDIIVDHNILFYKKAYYDDFNFVSSFNCYQKEVKYIAETHYNMLSHSKSMNHLKKYDPDKYVSWFDDTLSLMVGIPDLLDENNKMLYEYNCILKYCTTLFGATSFTFKERMYVYKRVNAVMKKYYPNYLKNKNVTYSKPNGFSGHFKKNVWRCIQFEKIDKFFHNHLLMRITQWLYVASLKTGTYK